MTQKQRPLRVAVIGSGAAGFFCADYLLRLGQPCEVVMFEGQPTPFGLVRDGVAPDKGNIRSVMCAFDRIATKEGFSWFGNVQIGRDIGVKELQELFDAVIVATGASVPRRVDIQGESLPGCFNARAFSGWYNGSLTANAIHPDLSHPAAVVIGAGNAALDMVRILASSPESLASTDISGSALATLRQNNVTDIHLVARRVPMKARFAPEELLALAGISGCNIDIRPDREFEEESNDSEESLRLQAAYRELVKMSACATQADKCIHLHFSMTPFGIMGTDKVEGALFMDAHGSAMYIPCGLVITSIGFTGQALAGLPFDEERGVIPNCAGRVTDSGVVIPGIYAAGWIKRGADGVIGTNKPCCRETVQAILDDRESLYRSKADTEKPIIEFMGARGIRFITYADWQKIDAAEQKHGSSHGKIRERFTSVEEVFAAMS